MVALPIIYFTCKIKRTEFNWKLFGGFIFLTYVGGFFVVMVLFIGIGSNIIKLLGILPDERFDLNKNAAFWNIYFFTCYGLWYLFSLVVICRWTMKGGSKSTMNIYKLTPRDLSSKDWKASEFKGVLIVRAEDARKALSLASSRYQKTPVTPPLSDTIHNPWTAFNVDYEKVTDSGYSTEGDEEILEEIL